MVRDIFVGIRLNADERATLDRVRQRLERNRADALHWALRRVAAELDVMENRRPTLTGGCAIVEVNHAAN